MLLFLLICTFGLSAGLDSRIYRGQDLRYDVHGYLVKLEIHENDIITCSGSIISSSWIITAAHCVYGNFQKLIVYHGGGPRIKQIAVVDKIDTKINPRYNAALKTVATDVALIYIRNPLQLSGYIKSIMLASFYPIVGEAGTIAGYGEHEAYINAPREGTVVITASDTEEGIITSLGPTRVGKGDSGGPLIMRGRLAGVISKTCNVPAIELTCISAYASVASNLNWIHLVTNSIV